MVNMCIFRYKYEYLQDIYGHIMRHCCQKLGLMLRLLFIFEEQDYQ